MNVRLDRKLVKISSLYWDSLGELHMVQAEEIIKLGYLHDFFESREAIPIDTDIVLVQGPYGSIASLVEKLRVISQESRPVLAYWFQQSLQLVGPRYLNSQISKFFSDLYWMEIHTRFGSGEKDWGAVRPSWLRGNRLGFMGDILWLGQNSLLDLLVLSSSVYADYFQTEKISSLIVPRGYYPGYGKNLQLARDIDLLWMGKTRTKRRKQIIHGLRESLNNRGMVMHVYDGVENGFIFGEKRTELLNRSRFVLNINSYSQADELSIRYFIAAANGAVIIREPNDNQYPFIPGKHLVECRPEEMPDVIEYYLDHPLERQRIADDMLNLISTELTLSNTISAILERLKRTDRESG
jgi:hypothetical protein